MRKRLAGIFAMVVMALCLMQTAAFATTMDVVQIDVGGAARNDEYVLIDDSKINLRKRDVVYELTGETDRPVNIWGSNEPADIDQAFYIKANNVKLNKGIMVQNSPVKMVVEVPAGTDNTIVRLSANDLTIKGSGTLRSNYLSVTQKTSYMPSALHITDTNIIVDVESNRYCEFNGPCVIDGTASVRFTSSGNYAPLHVGEKSGDPTHSLTLTDSAKLYCVHADPDAPAPYSVYGLEMFDAPLTVEGNAYLEAAGRPSTGAYAGSAIATNGDIRFSGNARVKATSTDVAISTAGSVTISGATVEAISSASNGIYAGGTLTFSDGATVTATGYWPAIFGNGALEISDSMVSAKATGDVAIFSRADVTIKNSDVKADAADNCNGIGAWDDVTVSGSWIQTSGPEDFEGSITNSVLFNGKSGKVIGNATVLGEKTVERDMTLAIPEGTSLSVGAGNALTNHGTVTVEGAFSADGGTVVCDSHSGGTATCAAKAVCDLCQAEYGELDPANHVDLKYVDAVAATTASEGNIEHWYCSGCGKYFSDAAATKEISKADTVTAKLPEEQKPSTGEDTKPGSDQDNKKPAADKNAHKAVPATGDASVAPLVAASLLAGLALLGGAAIRKR